MIRDIRKPIEPHPMRSRDYETVTFLPPSRRERLAGFARRYGKIALAIWIGYEVAPFVVGLVWYFR